MILLERGMIDLIDPVSKYLPGFSAQKILKSGEEVPPKREVSIHDLLSMTSGLPYGDTGTPASDQVKPLFDEIDSRLYGNSPLGLNEIANRLGKCPLEFEPGERWMYGTSADVLRAIVEVVAGCSFADFLEKELFSPLGMSDTGFFVPQEKQSRFAKVYREKSGVLYEERTNHLGIRYDMKTPPAFASGGAGLASTLDDYAKFGQMLLNRGFLNGVQILKPKTVDYFTSGGLTPWQMDSFGNPGIE